MPKRSNSEVGHAKNVANLEDLFTRCGSFGPAFNPPRAELQVSSLQQKHQEAQMTLRHLFDCEVREQDATNNRKTAFKALRGLATRIINAMIACGVSPKSVEDARVIQRRITGGRTNKNGTKTNLPTSEETAQDNTSESVATEAESTARTNSTSRQSYDLLVEHLSKLNLLLQRESKYTPNEPDLQLSGLQGYEQQLRYLLTMVTTAETASEAARIRRKEVLYDETTGLVAVALQTKSYVKALFGNNSAQYKQISGIPFRNY